MPNISLQASREQINNPKNPTKKSTQNPEGISNFFPSLIDVFLASGREIKWAAAVRRLSELEALLRSSFLSFFH